MAAPQTQPRLLRLRNEGTCAICRTAQPRGTEAWWYADKKAIVCIQCARVQSQPLTSLGQSGGSARREFARRKDRRERETLKKHPRVGKFILRVVDDPRTTRSWSKGAAGEEALGARLSELAGERLVVLHDRRIPASRGNIDHLAVTPGGVFVIDVKHYGGRLEKRNVGNIIRSDVRLYVGGRDRTTLLHGVADQTEVVRDALKPTGFVDVPVRGVLCFVGAEWGLFDSPFKLDNVLVTYPKFLYRLLGKDAEVATSAIQDAAQTLAIALPPA